jgi:thiol-disulfide isomerase/thioredoxin
MLINVTADKNFDELLSENDLVLGFFRTDWCPLCDYVENILTEIEMKYTSLNLFIIDFDKNKTLVDRYGIIGIPTVTPFRHGEIIGCFPGLYEDFAYEEIAHVLVFSD